MAAYLDTDDEAVIAAMSHLAVAKTYKLYIGGAFPRSESGRTYRRRTPSGGFLANAALASRKDARDAVVGRPQGLRRLVEGDAVQPRPGDLPDRRDAGGPAARVRRADLVSTGAKETAARAEVDAAVDRLVHYAGWTDKLAARARQRQPGLRAVLLLLRARADRGGRGVSRRADAPLLGLVSVVAPVITSGNACVVVAAEPDPCVAITFAEVLATSDVPGGVVNLLTGSAAEIGPHLAAHADVNALDLTGADAELRTAARAGGGRDGEAGLRAARAGPTSPPHRAPPGCGPSWRSRPSGTRPAPCRCPAGRPTDHVRSG